MHIGSLYVLNGVVYAGTSRGQVARWSGDTWEPLFARKQPIDEMWVSPSGVVYIVDIGRVYRWADSEVARASDLTQVITVWGTRDDDVWLGDCGSQVAHWDGSAWTNHHPGAEAYVGFCGRPGDLYVATENNGILHSDGTVWTTIECDGDLTRCTNLLGERVAFVGGYDLWIGTRDSLEHHAIDVDDGFHEDLCAVACGPSERIYLSTGSHVLSWAAGELREELKLEEPDYCYCLGSDGVVVAAGTDKGVWLLEDEWRLIGMP